MKIARVSALTLASLIAILSLVLSSFLRLDYRLQDRARISCPASHDHWLGTDALGRDRLARLVHGTRVALILAPAAASLSMLLAFLFGAVPGFLGGAGETAAKALIDLMLSLPWFFLLLVARALLPLNTSPIASAAITFLLLGLLGWGTPARVLLARARGLRQSEAIFLARSSGVSQHRLLWIHVAPNIWSVLAAQFWIALPVFILAEANLTLLGLGVSEPMPSLGSLLRELESAPALGVDPWVFSGLAVLLLFVGSLQVAFHQREAG